MTVPAGVMETTLGFSAVARTSEGFSFRDGVEVEINRRAGTTEGIDNLGAIALVERKPCLRVHWIHTDMANIRERSMVLVDVDGDQGLKFRF